MKNHLLIAFFILLNIHFLTAQTQTVKGRVIDQQSEMPLIGATIELIGTEETKGTTTDVDGYFRLEGIPIGRQVFSVSYLGYNSITVPNIVVTSGKEVSLNLALEESVEDLAEVVVTAKTDKSEAQNEMATISARTFSLEEVNRYSGGRSDVARLVGNFAGVSTADDSRNDIVVRGNSPTGVLWRLEGIPIPSPNHFSTLGTTGGPVSAMNPNMLRNSDFITSAFPSEYGNALAGVFDLGFRNGNKDKHEFMIQNGAFSGVEVMAEGPLSKKNNSSYLVAGRYSFVGLANAIGLSIGTNATPNYQDVSLKFNFGQTSAGQFTLFGIGGRSDIDFLHDETEEDDIFAATDQDAFARSRFGVVGLKHNLILDQNTYLRTIIAASTSQNDFSTDRYFNQDTPEEFVIDYLDVENATYRYTLSSFVNRKFSSKFTGRAGILIENEQADLFARGRENRPDRDGDGISDFGTLYDFSEGMTLLQAFVQTKYRLNTKLTINTGLHAQWLTLNDAYAFEPRLALNWSPAPKHRFNLGYGLHHQTVPLPILLLREDVGEGVFEETNRDLKFTRSNHFVLGYDSKFAPDWRAKVELYYQAISNVAVESEPTSFSILNVGADFGFPDDVNSLVNEGTGRNYGLELTLEKFFSKGYYGLLTASIFDSKYKGSDDVERNTAFNNGYVLNFLTGKEWRFGKAKKNAFVVDLKFTYAGGRYYTPVDLEKSLVTGTEQLFEDLAYSERYDAYLRLDMKLGVKFNSNKKKFSNQFYLDFQNVTNRENIFLNRYNRQTNQVNEVYQTAFFPDFLFRIQF